MAKMRHAWGMCHEQCTMRCGVWYRLVVRFGARIESWVPPVYAQNPWLQALSSPWECSAVVLDHNHDYFVAKTQHRDAAQHKCCSYHGKNSSLLRAAYFSTVLMPALPSITAVSHGQSVFLPQNPTAQHDAANFPCIKAHPLRTKGVFETILPAHQTFHSHCFLHLHGLSSACPQ